MSALGSTFDNAFKVDENSTFQEICMNAQNAGINHFYANYKKITYEVSLPKNGMNSDTSCLVVSGGKETYYNDVTDDDPSKGYFDPNSNCVVIGINSNSRSNHNDAFSIDAYLNAYDLCDNLEQSNGFNNTKNGCGYSASGYYSVIAGANRAEQLGENVNIFVCDASIQCAEKTVGKFKPEGDLSNLRILSFETVSGGLKNASFLQKLSDAGATIYRVNFEGKDCPLTGEEYTHGDVSTKMLISIGVKNISSDGINIDGIVGEVQKYENCDWVPVNDYNEIYDLFNSDTKTQFGFFNKSFKSLIDQIDTSDLNTIDYDCLRDYVSSLYSPLNKVMLDNSKTNLETNEISNSFLHDGLSSSIDMIKLINNGLCKKIYYELVYLLNNVSEVESKMDLNLSSLIGFSHDNNNLFDVYISNLSDEILETINCFNKKVTIPIDNSKDFGKISMSDLVKLGTSINSEINFLFDDMLEVKNSVDSFCLTDQMTNCDLWDVFTKKVSDYVYLLNTGCKSFEYYRENINDALKSILTYISNCGFDPLDSDKKPKLKTRIGTLNTENIKLRQKIDEKKQVTIIDDEYGNTHTEWVPVYSAAQIAAMNNIIERNNEEIEMCNKEIDAIDGLPQVINEANQMVNDALSEIYNSYGNLVNDFDVGVAVSYIAPTNTDFYNISSTGRFDGSQYNGSEGIATLTDSSSNESNNGVSDEMNERFSNVR